MVIGRACTVGVGVARLARGRVMALEEARV